MVRDAPYKGGLQQVFKLERKRIMSVDEGNELVTVYTLNDPGRAEVIRAVLNGEGITCQLGGESQAGFTGIFSIDVLVRRRDVDLARKILERQDEDRGSD
jgi:hypothetical protein